MGTANPIRSCVACRTRRPQEELVRIVRTTAGSMCLDEGRKHAPGRGAYLCPDAECVRQSARRRALQRALHAEMPAELPDELLRSIARRERE